MALPRGMKHSAKWNSESRAARARFGGRFSLPAHKVPLALVRFTGGKAVVHGDVQRAVRGSHDHRRLAADIFLALHVDAPDRGRLLAVEGGGLHAPVAVRARALRPCLD